MDKCLTPGCNIALYVFPVNIFLDWIYWLVLSILSYVKVNTFILGEQ